MFQSPIRSFSVCFLLLSLLLLVFPVRSSATYVFNIDDYGAQAEENSLAAAQANAKALTAALVAANTTGPGSVVLLEQGSSCVSMPFGGSGHVGVRIVIDGTLRMCDLSACRDSWPSDGSYRPFLQWDDGVQNTLEGTGMIDGQGYIWWWLFLLGRLAHKRPTMVYMTGGENLVVANLTMRNSPIMHMHMNGVTGAEIRDLTICKSRFCRHFRFLLVVLLVVGHGTPWAWFPVPLQSPLQLRRRTRSTYSQRLTLPAKNLKSQSTTRTKRQCAVTPCCLLVCRGRLAPAAAARRTSGRAESSRPRERSGRVGASESLG